MELGNASDIVSALCNVAMALSAVYAVYRAKDWFQENHFNQVIDFRKIMTKVDSQLLKFVMDSEGGDLEMFFALQEFKEADEQIDIMQLYLTVKMSKELKNKYNAFKRDRINSWREARDYSHDPDHVYKEVPDFYRYLSTLPLRKR